MKNRYRFTIIGIFAWTLVFVFAGNTHAAVSVKISSPNLQQADTLLVTVADSPGQPSGRMGLVQLHFMKSAATGDWVALVGVPVDKKPGIYPLSITSQGKLVYQNGIIVAKRNFPVTALAITPQLKKQGYTAKKIITTVEGKEKTALEKVLDAFTQKAYFTAAFSYPLANMRTVGNFGDIRKAKGYEIQHLGVDLKAAAGTPVMAANAGKVVFERKLPDYGNTLIIDHGLGVYSLYLHLSKFEAAKGKMVAKGSEVALSGATGYVTGPHLHFSIKVRGAALDPLKFIQTSQLPW